MAAAKSLPFVIPKAIRRSKTDLLKALSSTVGTDTTAPHFAFIDDPTTIPTTEADKRIYYMSKEFGRQAARQLAVEWPTLFMFDREEPRLNAFRPTNLPPLPKINKSDVVSQQVKLEEDEFILLLEKAGSLEGVQEILKDMAEKNVRPSIRTFNAAILAITKTDKEREEKWKAMCAYFSEAKRINLEPSLNTYKVMLYHWIPKKEEKRLDRAQMSVNCLGNILNDLENRPAIEWVEAEDEKFFGMAMLVATYARNPDLIDRVERLYRSPNNKVQMSAFQTEPAFYSHYLLGKIKLAKHVDEVGQLYLDLVPRIVGASRMLIEEMVRKLKNAQNWPLTKRVIEDGIASRCLYHKDHVDMYFELLRGTKTDKSNIDAYEALVARIDTFLAEIEALKELEAERDKRRQEQRLKLEESLQPPVEENSEKVEEN